MKREFDSFQLSTIESAMWNEDGKEFCEKKKKNLAVFVTGNDVLGNATQFGGSIYDVDEKDGRSVIHFGNSTKQPYVSANVHIKLQPAGQWPKLGTKSCRMVRF